VRAAAAVLALSVLATATGCAELGVVTDGTSISYGKPNRGRLIDGMKLPDSGAGFTTAPVWKERGNRFGTNELVTMIKGVGKRMKKKSKDARLVVADLSGTGGGAAHTFHRSHQSGRDVDLLYYVRDAQGKAFEPDVMRVFDGRLLAKDGSGVTLDVTRTWLLVKELLTAQEAYVQFIFMYRPIAEKLIEHATKIGESDVVIARAMKALKQPGDSAPHNDHMHVRIYCPPTDRMYGCVDIGPLELLAEREGEAHAAVEAIAAALPPSSPSDTVADADESESETPARTAADVWQEAQLKSSRSTLPTSVSSTDPFRALLRASAHRIDLRGWR
jgi:penicillin-insensitive murein DD-endopeptidase